MINFFKDLLNFFRYKRHETNCNIGFFCETNFIYQYIEPYIKKKIKKRRVIIISFENIIDKDIEQKSVFVFRSNFFRELVFLTLNLKYLYSSTPDLNYTIFKKSRLNKCKYIYLQHTPVSLTMIYKEKAFNAFDAIQVISNFQYKEMLEIKNKFSLKTKIFKSKYLFTDKISKSSDNKVIDLLIAPTWNTSFFKLNCHKLLKKALDESKLSYKIRPHPMSYTKGEISKNEIKNLEMDIDDSEFIDFKKYNFFVSDWSGLFIEYALIFKRKSYLINTPKKVSNENYKNYSSIPIEISLRNILCKTYEIQNISEIVKDILKIKENFKNSNKITEDLNIKKIIDENFY